jgi:hypothetical protein
MEKYARQALLDGTRLSSELHVTVDSEIYKVRFFWNFSLHLTRVSNMPMQILNQHYNKDNCITPPAKLREVIEQTLRKFFESMQQGRDTEDPGWKKVSC